jgi:hypothetical protein
MKEHVVMSAEALEGALHLCFKLLNMEGYGSTHCRKMLLLLHWPTIVAPLYQVP